MPDHGASSHLILAMPILLLIGSLLALWGFVIWERRRPVASLPREARARGWALSAAARWSAYAGLVLLYGVLGLLHWFRPSHPPFTGKGAWAYALAYAQLGPKGVALLWWAGGVLLLALGLASWRVASASSKSFGREL